MWHDLAPHFSVGIDASPARTLGKAVRGPRSPMEGSLPRCLSQQSQGVGPTATPVSGPIIRCKSGPGQSCLSVLAISFYLFGLPANTHTFQSEDLASWGGGGTILVHCNAPLCPHHPLIAVGFVPGGTLCLAYSEQACSIPLYSCRLCAQTPTVQVTIGALSRPESWPQCWLRQPVSGTQ